MRYLPTSKLTPGMALGQDIYDGAGRRLLARHLLLSAEYISNLEFLGFPGVYIDDEFTRGIEIQQVLNPEVRSQALKIINEMFTTDAGTDQISTNEIKLQKTVEHVVEDILSNGDVMCNMLDIKNYDEYIFYHSVHVGVLSALLGAHYGFDQKQLYELTTAAMLHDIGKKFLNPEIVNEERRMTEQEEVTFRQHAREGAEFLKNNYHFSSSVCDGVAEHHEAYNGEGYPNGKSGEEIFIYARIIHIADRYDALISGHPLREALSPSDAVEYLMSEAGGEFDPALVTLFLEKIAVYPVGCEVMLSNGKHAVVAKNFERFSLRPLIKLMDSGDLLNLRDDSECRCVTIVKMIMK